LAQKAINGEKKIMAWIPSKLKDRFQAYVDKAKKLGRYNLEPITGRIVIARAVEEYMNNHPIK